MKNTVWASIGLGLISVLSLGQTVVDVTGTPVPSDLLRQNYGRLPKGVGAYDLNVCNSGTVKQSVVSSQIYQALWRADANVEPIGRDIILAVILHNQSRDGLSIVNVSLNAVAGIFSVLTSSKDLVPGTWSAGIAIAALSTQQLITALRPLNSANQLEKFESEVLEPVLLLDGGSCAERIVFARTQKSQIKASALSFHVR